MVSHLIGTGVVSPRDRFRAEGRFASLDCDGSEHAAGREARASELAPGISSGYDSQNAVLGWLAMWQSVPMHVVSGLGALEELVTACPRPLILVFDADNTLVPQGVTVAEFQSGVNNAIRRFESLANVGRVVVASNGSERGVSAMVHRANKPWTTRSRLGLTAAEPDVWVVGDQILTDGVLAWRLGATFVHLVYDEATEGRRQSVMRSAGRYLTGILFSQPEEDGNHP